MNLDLNGLTIAIIGGNDPCARMIDHLTGPKLEDLGLTVVMVADTLVNSKGLEKARQLRIPFTNVYSDMCRIKNLDLILKLKNDETLPPVLEILENNQVNIMEMDSFKAMSFIRFLEIQEELLFIKKQLRDKTLEGEAVGDAFEAFSKKVMDAAEERNRHLKDERETLLEMEKELTQVIQGSMIPTFIINNEHIITHWNRACEDLTGHRAYELVGTDRQWVPFRSAKRPTMADAVVDKMAREKVAKYYGASWRKSSIINGGYEAEEFFPHLGEDGKWIFFTAAPIKSPDGKIIGAIETLLDKTEDKKAEAEIALQDRELAKLHEKYKKSEEKYRSLFNNNPNPIFILDSKTLEILDFNHRVESTYGHTKSGLIGESFLELGEKNDPSVKQGLLELNNGKSILLTKKRHFKKSGDPFYVNIIGINTTYSSQDVIIACTTDITETVEKEAQLIQAGKLATLGTMAAGMAHEINQPLNVIQICADLILKMMKKGIAISDDELKTMAGDIIDNVARAAGVIKHVRDFSRQSERDLKKLNLNDPINDVFKVLGHQITVHSIKVDLNLDPDLPLIMAEHNRLEQVFINLVTNAIDAMDEKEETQGQGIEKKLTIATWAENKKVVAAVSDTGTGMSEEVKQKIFEPFFTTKETGKGTGLGTSISFGIIRDYSGIIEIESREGEGAKFIIKFPAV